MVTSKNTHTTLTFTATKNTETAHILQKKAKDTNPKNFNSHIRKISYLLSE